MRRVLSRLDRRWLAAASKSVCGEVGNLIDTCSDHPIEHILAFVSFFPGEIDLSTLIGERSGSCKTYLPRVTENGAMQFIEVGPDWLSSVRKGYGGIPEPGADPTRVYEGSAPERTAVIVPGLAFDREGNRLGRGGGYYDRFFSRPGMGRALKIGTCWSLQILDSLPSQEHDVMMDWVCHEKGHLKTGLSFGNEDFDSE